MASGLRFPWPRGGRPHFPWSLWWFLWVVFTCLDVQAQETVSQESSPSPVSTDFPFFSVQELELGGHLKTRLGLNVPASGSIFHAIESGTLWDNQNELRLKGRCNLNGLAEIEAHNESFLVWSETQGMLSELGEGQGGGSADVLTPQLLINDRTRLMNLTWTWEEGKKLYAVNRFDRLSLALFPSWGVIKAGRQAISWGNGMLFNPFDIFAPFAPTTLDRDYKQGEDALSVQVNAGDQYGDVQVIYIPRRNVVTRDVSWEDSSVAANYHLPIPDTEWELNLMGACHYQDFPMGAGVVGYMGGSALRLNTTWTHLKQEDSGFLSLVANVDYGWVWWGLNFYGWVEYYYNGLGEPRGRYAEAVRNAPLRERLLRGELYVRGRHYVDAQVRVELHPLVNLQLVAITNVVDPSGVIQPYLTWDLHENLRLNVSASLYGAHTTPNTAGWMSAEPVSPTGRPTM